MLATIAVLLAIAGAPSPAAALQIDTPPVGLTGVPLTVSVSGAPPASVVDLAVGDESLRAVSDADGLARFDGIVIPERGSTVLAAHSDGDSATTTLRVIPGWVSVLPAVLAIVIALLFRNVIPALLLGLWFGATALTSFSSGGVFRGLLDSFQVYVAAAVADTERASIILFTMMIGGMVGIITRNGGMASVVRMIVSRARSAIGGQVAVWLMGLMIFFDDYSNTLVVGNTARSLTDHLKISREKLAYIVDSTAAPVACIALITTWIGYQLGLLSSALANVDELSHVAAYSVFLNSIPYSFYAIFAVAFVLIVASSGRDFGPMLAAEVRARRGQVKPDSADALPALEGDELAPKPGIPLRALNAFVPIVALISALAASLWITGEGDSLTGVLGSADPYKSMMYASFIGVLVAVTITIGQRILSVHETVDAWYGGVRATLFGMIILVLAWSLSDITAELNTADYLVTVLADSLPVALLPASVFVLAAITAFTTGTSWGTMGILMPLVIPLTWAVMQVNGMDTADGMHILYSAVSCCLVGAVWGDHCSPISDTTVLSSVASGCNHIEHVRTQLPYALFVGGVALGVGTIPGGYGLSPWISLPVGVAILFAAHRVFGKSADSVAAAV
ncbi:MAG: Na+/H+ antiporter NhaC family protein [Woeseiaceae bacterium]|nr:Na+/H+ antiporter NhaC family protein [Woeseiaceae bacterium]